MARKRIIAFLLSVGVATALAVTSGIVYFNDHAWGAWGDDSAGYIYLAGRMFVGDPLVYTDELAAKGFEFFEDEKLARWLTPTHHQFINRKGVIASKYPVGLSILMVIAAKAVHSSGGFYIVNPLLAAANIGFVYLLSLLLLPQYRFRHLVGIVAAFILSISNLYYDHALAQPMREIPSIAFLLVTVIFLILACRYIFSAHSKEQRKNKNMWFGYFMAMLSGLSYGMAINVRETSIMILPGLVAYVWFSLSDQKKTDWRKKVRTILPASGIFALAMSIALIPTILNSYHISQKKEVFKARDKSSIVLLSNINHIDTISIDNLFDNEGKFRPGKGALPHYWDVLQHASPLPYFLALVLVGIVYLWKKNRPATILFLFWIFGTLTIFSLWINPYARYILPLFPPLAILGAYGLFAFFEEFLRFVTRRKFVLALGVFAVLVSVVLAYKPLVLQAKENYKNDVYIFKAISKGDLDTLINLGSDLQKEEKAVLMFSGEWQYGTSETLEAHTGLKTIRFPFEQRFVFQEDKVYTFFDQVLNDGYSLYVWIDSTSSAEAIAFIEQYTATPLHTLQFTFQDNVTIYRITR